MTPKSEKRSKISIIRFIYLYLISAITFIVFLIGAVTIVDQGLKSFVFGVEEYDYEYEYPVRVPLENCEIYFDAENNDAYKDCLGRQKSTVEERIENPKGFSNNVKRRLSIGVAQVLVAFPLWIFHWGIIERDRKRKHAKK